MRAGPDEEERLQERVVKLEPEDRTFVRVCFSSRTQLSSSHIDGGLSHNLIRVFKTLTLACIVSVPAF